MELRYCNRSPPGVSHFQGPHEHVRPSCETAERGWLYETATEHLVLYTDARTFIFLWHTQAVCGNAGST